MSELNLNAQLSKMDSEIKNTMMNLFGMFAEQSKLIAEQKEALEKERKEFNEYLDTQKSKINYCDKVLGSNSAWCISTIAQDFGMTGRQMNKVLHKLGIQYKIEKGWKLYKQYNDKGYIDTTTLYYRGNNTTFPSMRWTEKGRKFIYDTLTSHGYKAV